MPLDSLLLNHIILQLCHALELLHLSGQSHGDLTADRVGLESQGRAVLLGSGRRPGSVEADVAALFSLYQRLGGVDIPDVHGNLDSLIVHLGDSPPPAQNQLTALHNATPPLPDEASLLEVLLTTAATTPSIDEVGIDLGPDEQSKGILDEWTGGGTDEGAERTGTLSPEAVAEQRLLALLSRLGRQPGDRHIPAHIQALNGPPLESIVELMSNESLDPLPSPGSMDAPRNQASGETSEGEVTRARLGPLLPGSELDDVTAARIENTESFSSTAEVTRIRPRPKAPTERSKKKLNPLLWLTILGWGLALVALFFILKSGSLPW
jgi:hypothetical protein